MRRFYRFFREKPIPWSFLIYTCLLVSIILPYVLRPGLHLAGNDTSFFEYASGWNLERSLYYWRHLNGAGGESFQGSGSVIFLLLLTVLVKLTSPLIAQVVFKLAFYSAAFAGIYLLIRESCSLLKREFDATTASLVAFFYCTNLLGFDLIRTWLNLYYIFFLLTPLLLFFYIKTIKSEKPLYLFGFLGLTLINQACFSNVSYPAIQYLVFFCGQIFFLEKKEMKRAFVLLFVFTLINVTAFFEYVLAYIYQRNNLFSNSLNVKLITDAPTVQKRFYPLSRIVLFESGRLLEGTRWAVGGSKKIFAAGEYYLSSIIECVAFFPFLSVSSFFLKKNRELKLLISYLLFLLSLVLVSMFGFPPLEPIFTAIFAKVPILWVFRNSLKFSLVALIFFSFPLYFCLVEQKVLRVLFIVYLGLMSFYCVKGDFADIYSFTKIPTVYQNLDAEIGKLPLGTGDRMMAFPAFGDAWLVYSFGYMGYHPLIALQNRVANFSNDAYGTGQFANIIYDRIANLAAITSYDFRKYAIKYVMVNHDIDYDTYHLDQKQYDQTVQFFERNFSKVLENESFSIYKIYDETTDIVSAEQSSTKMINPTKYKITLKNLQSSREVIFNQSFNSSWALYLSGCNETTQGIKSSFFQGDELKYLFKSDDFWQTHALANEYANAWRIDPVRIKQLFPSNCYHLRPDGSIDVNLTLYFKPQSFYYLGIIIAIFVLSGSTVYGGYLFFRYRVKDK